MSHDACLLQGVALHYLGRHYIMFVFVRLDFVCIRLVLILTLAYLFYSNVRTCTYALHMLGQFKLIIIAIQRTVPVSGVLKPHTYRRVTMFDVMFHVRQRRCNGK